MALTLCTLLLTICSLITAAPEPSGKVNNNGNNNGNSNSGNNFGSNNNYGGHRQNYYPPAPQWHRPSWLWNWHAPAPPLPPMPFPGVPGAVDSKDKINNIGNNNGNSNSGNNYDSNNAYHSQRGLSDPVNSKRQQSDDDVKFVEVEKDPQLLLLDETSDKALAAGLEDGQKFICVDIHCAAWPDNFLVVATTEEQAAEVATEEQAAEVASEQQAAEVASEQQAAEVASEQQAAEVVNEAPAADQAPEQPAKREVSDEVELAARDAAAPLQDDSTTTTAVVESTTVPATTAQTTLPPRSRGRNSKPEPSRAERRKSQLSKYTDRELMEELSRRVSSRRQKMRQTAEKSITRGGWAGNRTRQTVKSGRKAAAPVEA